MEYFSKHVPAFSRALGDSDSDYEFDIEQEAERRSLFFTSSGSCEDAKTAFQGKICHNLIIAVGPLQATFITCALHLSPHELLGRFSYLSPKFGGQQQSCTNFGLLYHLPKLADGTFVVTLPQSKQMIDYTQRDAVENIMNAWALSADGMKRLPEITILCSQPVYQFQSLFPPESVPFNCLLQTSCKKPPTSVPFKLLQPPNIVSGFPAEFLTWCNLHSFPANLIVSFHDLCEDPVYAWYSVKGIFKTLFPLSQSLHAFHIMPTEWSVPGDDSLKDDCIKLICGDRPSRMDQMYT
ncbi:unnamed protein product [Calicophoron daubneyi]|uniref:Proteasome assembly chaperone 1 n=1 Tax=Calicophoron daubneyi TaxID=300641 RepID=A0AAV2TX79_CALDB